MARASTSGSVDVVSVIVSAFPFVAVGPWTRVRSRPDYLSLAGDEPLEEVQRRLRDLLPAVIDRQRVTAVGHLLDLGDARVPLLPLVGGLGDRPRDGVVLLALDDQQRATVRIPRIDLGLGEGFRFAFAICIRATPGPATWYVSY